MKTIEFAGIEFETASEAIQHVNASGRGVAITGVAGANGSFVVEQAEADRLAAAGVEFAYLIDHEMPDGTFRVLTVPVN